MFALTNAPAHLLILVAPERMSVEADPELTSGQLPTSLWGDRITSITVGESDRLVLQDFVSMLRHLSYTVVVEPY